MLTKTQIAAMKTMLEKESRSIPIVFQALGDPCRYRIFRLLTKHHDICVTDIANICSITVSAASQQLRVLERIGLVVRMRMGQVVCYEISNENHIAGNLIKMLKEQ